MFFCSSPFLYSKQHSVHAGTLGYGLYVVSANLPLALGELGSALPIAMEYCT